MTEKTTPETAAEVDTEPVEVVSADEARAVFEAEIARGEAEAEANAKKEAAAKARATKVDFAQRIKDRKAEAKSLVPTAGKDAEQAAKEASVPPSDPRDSVFDAAPGKSFEDVVERNEARAAGKFTDTPETPKPVQHFIVTDEADLLEVAGKLGLADHAELGAVNGRYNSNYGVQRGERVILPAQYTFVDIEGVVTAGDEAEELAGSEPTA